MKFGPIKKFFIVVFSAIFIFGLLNFCGAGGIKNFFYNQSSGLQAYLWQKGSALSFLSDNQDRLNRNLTEQNQILFSNLTDLEVLKKENETLRQALSLGLNQNYELIMGQVTARDSFRVKGVAYSDSILINKGNADGVKKGFPVVLGSKILLGKVVDVYENYSRVILLSSKDSVIDVSIAGTDVFALSKGQGGQKISLDMFPKDKDLQPGSLVVTSALGSAYPSGLLVGTIGQVNNVDSETFKKADINPAYSLNTLDYVFIIKNIVVTNEQ
jgi:rod shape-determining protein MreC